MTDNSDKTEPETEERCETCGQIKGLEDELKAAKEAEAEAHEDAKDASAEGDPHEADEARKREKELEDRIAALEEKLSALAQADDKRHDADDETDPAKGAEADHAADKLEDEAQQVAVPPQTPDEAAIQRRTRSVSRFQSHRIH